MKVLIAEDDEDQALNMERFMKKLGHEPSLASNGQEAFTMFKQAEYPLIITDWMMPGLTGPQLCTMIRSLARDRYTYIILLTALREQSRTIEGLKSGADDFLRKPVDFDELAARITVAERIQGLHNHVTALEGILSICAECKKIRDDAGDWVGVEAYMSKRTDLSFSHGYCPSCLARTREAWGLSQIRKTEKP